MKQLIIHILKKHSSSANAVRKKLSSVLEYCIFFFANRLCNRLYNKKETIFLLVIDHKRPIVIKGYFQKLNRSFLYSIIKYNRLITHKRLVLIIALEIIPSICFGRILIFFPVPSFSLSILLFLFLQFTLPGFHFLSTIRSYSKGLFNTTSLWFSARFVRLTLKFLLKLLELPIESVFCPHRRRIQHIFNKMMRSASCFLAVLLRRHSFIHWL